VPEKNAALLIEACSKLVVRGLECSLVIVGGGPERAALEVQAKGQLGRRAIFTGFVQPAEVLKYYALADVFVLPSSYEPWGAVVSEAMAAALPVIVSDQVGAAYDLIADRRDGIIISNGDEGSLVAALSLLVRDKDVRETMGRRARERMRGLNHEFGVAQFREAVKHVLATHRQS
jgi:glycosyltransferase involved in cell wall biosynthesis